MDKKAFYNLSYGVFILGTKSGEKINACIINTCFQAAVNPVRIAISSIKQNLTCQMIKESGVFSLSALDSTCTFDMISRFGYQTGRGVDKFKDYNYLVDSNGCPYINNQVCSVFECKVVSSVDLESHVLFIAEVTDAKVLSQTAPLTYADYQTKLKPKKSDSDSNSKKKIIAWRCKICGYVYENPELPKDFECPLCGHPADDFEPVYEE